MKRYLQSGLLAAIALLCLSLPSRASDVQVFPTGPVFTLNVAWGGGAGGFNNNFFFIPISQSEYVCTYVLNNNPTNSHTFVEQINFTPNAAEKTPSDGTWPILGVAASTTLNVFPSSPSLFGVKASGSAFIAIEMSVSVPLGGTPDTANIIIVQSQDACFGSVQNTFLSVQPNTGIVANTESTSAANTAVSTTVVSTSSGIRAVVFSVSARCSAGTAQLIIKDGGAAGTQVWSTGATEVTTTTFRYQWNPGLTSQFGPGNMFIQLSSCGVANTGTLDVQASASNGVF